MPPRGALLLLFVFAAFPAFSFQDPNAAVQDVSAAAHDHKIAGRIQRDVENLIVDEGFLMTTEKPKTGAKTALKPAPQPHPHRVISDSPHRKPHKPSVSFDAHAALFKPRKASAMLQLQNRTHARLTPLQRLKRFRRPNALRSRSGAGYTMSRASKLSGNSLHLSRPAIQKTRKNLVKITPGKKSVVPQAAAVRSEQRLRRKARPNDDYSSDSREPVPLDPAFLEQYGNSGAHISVVAPKGPSIASEEDGLRHYYGPTIIQESHERVFPIKFEEVEVVQPGDNADYGAYYVDEAELGGFGDEEPSQTFLPEDNMEGSGMDEEVEAISKAVDHESSGQSAAEDVLSYPRDRVGGGERGEKGETGDKGEPGERGPQGLVGPPGVCMAECRDGRDGMQGPRGEQGPLGPQGPMGPPGPPGEVVRQSMEDSGTEVQTVTGPQGPQGAPGPQGPMGPRGDPGVGIPGPPGPAGRYLGLTEDDIERIVADPRIKAQTSECCSSPARRFPGMEEEPDSALPPYDSSRHRFTMKGEKGERGEHGSSGIMGPQGPQGPIGPMGPMGIQGPMGPMGPPGPQGQAGPQGQSGQGSAQGGSCPQPAAGAGPGCVQVYQTSIELFSSAGSSPVVSLGSLSFSISSQQLFIRVNGGWKEVRLEGFHPTLEQRPAVDVNVLPPIVPQERPERPDYRPVPSYPQHSPDYEITIKHKGRPDHHVIETPKQPLRARPEVTIERHHHQQQQQRERPDKRPPPPDSKRPQYHSGGGQHQEGIPEQQRQDPRREEYRPEEHRLDEGKVSGTREEDEARSQEGGKARDEAEQRRKEYEAEQLRLHQERQQQERQQQQQQQQREHQEREQQEREHQEREQQHLAQQQQHQQQILEQEQREKQHREHQQQQQLEQQQTDQRQSQHETSQRIEEEPAPTSYPSLPDRVRQPEPDRYRERPAVEAQHHRHQPAARPHTLGEKDHVLHLIALNAPMSGNMRGVRGADLACYQQARQAGFRTTFRAFLSSHVQDLNKVVHFGDRETAVVNLRGEQLFNSWSDIFRERPMFNAPLYSFNRRNIFEDNTWPIKKVWHGSDPGGSRSESGYCNAWRSADRSHVGSSSPLGVGLPLLDGCQNVDCSNEFIVLCVENMSKYSVDKRLGKKRMHFEE